MLVFLIVCRCKYLSEELLFSLRLPKEIVAILKVKDLSAELRLLVALELYREEVLSLGKAAEVAGLGISELLYEFRKRGIPLNYDLEEAQRDIKTLEGL